MFWRQSFQIRTILLLFSHPRPESWLERKFLKLPLRTVLTLFWIRSALPKMPHSKVQLFLIIAFTSSLARLISFTWVFFAHFLVSHGKASKASPRSVSSSFLFCNFFPIFSTIFFLPNRKNTEQSGLIENLFNFSHNV